MSRFFTALVFAASCSSLAACGAKPGAGADSSSAASPSATPAAAAGASATPAPPTIPDPRVTRADVARIKGSPNAPLWIIVVSDFQCPYCGQWERETAAQVMKEFVDSGIARLAFINYPLNQHANAMPAAEAAMCAGSQGKFWEMHDVIFRKQGEWSTLPSAEGFFAAAAKEVGLAADEYQSCVANHVMRPMIMADEERATTGGARSTPTFFIGNQTLSGAEKIDAFRKAVEAAKSALAKK